MGRAAADRPGVTYASVRILLLSNMYPSRARPEYGVFVRRLELALRERGNEVLVVADGRAGGGAGTALKYGSLAVRSLAAARRARPDVVYAHYLVPTGVAAALTGVPYVVTAHGQDVANIGRVPGVARATRMVLRRAAAVVCVSRYLAERLPLRPARLEVIDCGVDTRRLTPAARAPGRGPRFLFVGSLTERKNPLALIEAFARLGEGSLTLVGEGPLTGRVQAAGVPGVRLTGRLSAERLAEEMATADVYCQPSLVEPQGQAILEAMARGRPVVATAVGGPPEYVTPECGVLVDPADVEQIAQGMARAARLPVPCDAAVTVARAHDIGVQAEKIETLLRSVSLPA